MKQDIVTLFDTATTVCCRKKWKKKAIQTHSNLPVLLSVTPEKGAADRMKYNLLIRLYHTDCQV